MENQAHHIQALLSNELDKYKGKKNTQADEHIYIIQKTYQDTHHGTPQMMTIDKGKQK